MKVKYCSCVIVCNILCIICNILLLNMNLYLVAIKKENEEEHASTCTCNRGAVANNKVMQS